MQILCAVLECGLLAGVPMRPEEIARLMRWLAGPRTEQTDPDDAAKGDGGGYSRGTRRLSMIGIGILSVALLSGTSPAAAVDVAAERAALARADKAWSEAAVSKDVERVVSFWTDDATVYPPGQPAVVGKDALRRYVTEGFAIPGFSIRWETRAFEVSASGDMAYGLGTNVVTMNDAQGKVMTERGRGVTVWRKGKDGSWKCVVDVWNAGPVMPPPGH